MGRTMVATAASNTAALDRLRRQCEDGIVTLGVAQAFLAKRTLRRRTAAWRPESGRLVFGFAS